MNQNKRVEVGGTCLKALRVAVWAPPGPQPMLASGAPADSLPWAEGTASLPWAVCVDSQDTGPFAVKAFRPEPQLFLYHLRHRFLWDPRPTAPSVLLIQLLHHQPGPEPLPHSFPRDPSDHPAEPAAWPEAQELAADPPAGRECGPGRGDLFVFRGRCKLFRLALGPTCSWETPAEHPCDPPSSGLTPCTEIRVVPCG